MRKLLMLLAFVALMVFGCSSSPSSPDSMIWGNLDAILDKGGITAVVLIFGYLYLRSVLRNTTRQIEKMQDQVARQQEIMVTALNNNTSALTQLSTAMMMGCPMIKEQLDRGKNNGE